MSANLRFAIGGAVLASTALLVGVSILLLEGDGAATPREDRRIDLRDAVVNQEQRRLRLCVQAVYIGPLGRSMPGDPAVEELAKERMESALEEVAEDPLWTRAGKDALEPPLVDTGCPFPPVAFEANEEMKIVGRSVWDASYYGVFTFVVPSDEYERLFKGGPPAITEELRPGHQPIGVTLGVYLTEAQLEDSDYLTDVMTRAVGLKAFEKTLPR